MAAEPIATQSPVPGRRAFFSRMMGEAVTVVDDVRGVPHYRLSDLPGYPPDKLAKLVPVIRDGVRISLEEGYVHGIAVGDTESVPLFAANHENTLIFNRFTGENTLGDIAAELATAADLPPEQAFSQTRQLFLDLVNASICVPCNDPA